MGTTGYLHRSDGNPPYAKIVNYTQVFDATSHGRQTSYVRGSKLYDMEGRYMGDLHRTS
jgi:hypothetical protein